MNVKFSIERLTGQLIFLLATILRTFINVFFKVLSFSGHICNINLLVQDAPRYEPIGR